MGGLPPFDATTFRLSPNAAYDDIGAHEQRADLVSVDRPGHGEQARFDGAIASGGRVWRRRRPEQAHPDTLKPWASI
ncbi:MAG: hypothetical protein JOY78_18600 [Pseudonocardia sp.]|nr:hypothetical protein [Pseudonocardia sp.]